MRSLLDLPPEHQRPEWKTCPVPGRPWWRDNDSSAGNIWAGSRTRADGAVVWMREASAAQACAEYDAAHPLPHPGYRVGQVWARRGDNGNWYVCIIDAHHMLATSQAWFSLAERFVGAEFSVLLHDPIRPDLAPWSSV